MKKKESKELRRELEKNSDKSNSINGFIFFFGLSIIIVLSLIIILKSAHAMPTCAMGDDCLTSLEDSCNQGYKCVLVGCTGYYDYVLNEWFPPGATTRCLPCTADEIENGDCNNTDIPPPVVYEYASTSISFAVSCDYSEGSSCSSTDTCDALPGCDNLYCRGISSVNDIDTANFKVYTPDQLPCTDTDHETFQCKYAFCGGALNVTCTYKTGSGWSWRSPSVLPDNNAIGDFCCEDSECGSKNCVDNVCMYASEDAGSCSNGIDDDGDGYIDEEDSDCSFTLTVTPDPASYLDTLTGTISSGVYGTTKICDYQGCNATGGCVGDEYCSLTNGATSCTISPTPSPDYGKTGAYGYYACNGENAIYDEINVEGPKCGDTVCDSGYEDCTTCSSDCVCSAETGNCNDNLDNDGDGLVDEADPDCAISLSITPDPTVVDNGETAQISASDGNLNLDGRSVLIARDSFTCSSNVVCTISSGSTCSFTAPSTANTYVYYACTSDGTNNVKRASDYLTVCVSNKGASCDDNNECTIGETIQCDGTCGGGSAISGTHYECSGSSCVSVANTVDACTDTCSNNGDCGSAVCGDDFCDSGAGENCSTCPSDCGSCSYCGDGVCDAGAGENSSTCPDDCPLCNPINYVNGLTRSCYTGPDGTLDVGECSAGTSTCSRDTSTWPASYYWSDCNGEVTPIVESCVNGLDDDCDGFVDCDDPDCSSAINCLCNNGVLDSGEECDGSAGSLNCDDDCTCLPGYTPYGTSGDCVYNQPCVSDNDCSLVTYNDETICVYGVCEGSTCSYSEDDSKSCDLSVCTHSGWDDSSCTEICNNGVDDDGDNLADCSDPDCANDPFCCSGAEFEVTVLDEKGNTVSGALVSVVNGDDDCVTDSDGLCSLKVPLGDHSLSAVKDLYRPNITEVSVDSCDDQTISLMIDGSPCDADCTDWQGICQASCEGQNGCSFENNIVKETCDGVIANTWVDDGAGDWVLCCGTKNNYDTRKIIKEELSPEGPMKHLVRYERLLKYGNRLVKLVTFVWQEK